MKDISSPSAKGTPRTGPEAGTSGTPPTAPSSGSTSSDAHQVAEAIAKSAGGRIVQPDLLDAVEYVWCHVKHWFGVHTFIDVYHWDVDSGQVSYIGQECRRCALPG